VISTVFAALFASTVSLDGAWNLDYWPQPDDGAVRTLPLPSGLAVKQVAATVPGNCELDLVNAGLLPAMEVGCNTSLLRPYEGYQWLYSRTFERPEIPAGGRVLLRFEGVDTLADVFLNGEKIGETENMFIAHRFDITKRLRAGRNELKVLLRSVMCESQNETLGILGGSMAGGKDAEPYRKAGYMGGWDIFPRAFVSGLWRSVALDVEGPVSVDNPVWFVKAMGKTWATVYTSCRVRCPHRLLDKATMRWSLVRNGRRFEQTARLTGHNPTVSWWHLDGIERWWPKGMGEPALYASKIEVLGEDGAVLVSVDGTFGFRTIELVRDDVYSAERPGQFLFKVNGEPCYVRGSNWVPLDSFPSRQAARVIPTLEMWEDLNCNMVRVWGGGVYEPDAFYDWCDAHGVMVWQDFMTGCSVFPQDDRYAKLTREEIVAMVVRLRNHPSIALWSGNNENDGAFRWQLAALGPDPNRDRSSRRTIPEALMEFDVSRPYLPSSPYYSPDVFAKKAKPSEDHLWGAREYYKVPFYTNSPCWFASEMGYHGCPNRASLEKMMSKDKVYPWTKVINSGKNPKTDFVWNDEWVHKASDWKGGDFGQRRNSLMTNQVKIMFGGVDTDLDTFIAQSQFVQAEAMKTFCELFRSRKFTRFNGLIWWNVIDGCPQISDAVVDWYGGKKPAYAALRNAQQDQIVCLVDDGTAWAVNDTLKPVKGSAKLTDAATGRVLLEKSFEIPCNGKLALGRVAFAGQGVVKIDATLGGRPYHNHFLYGEPPFDWTKVKEWMR